MLKLLVFAPAERVIVGEDKLTSIIVLLEAVDVQQVTDFPVDAIVAMSWNVMMLWHRTEDVTEPVNYEERIEIIRPDGKRVGGGNLDFTVTNEHTNYRSIIRMDKFPIGIAGRCWVKLFLREAGETNEWREMAEYPIVIRHIQKEAPDEAGENTQP